MDARLCSLGAQDITVLISGLWAVAQLSDMWKGPTEIGRGTRPKTNHSLWGWVVEIRALFLGLAGVMQWKFDRSFHYDGSFH